MLLHTQTGLKDRLPLRKPPSATLTKETHACLSQARPEMRQNVPSVLTDRAHTDSLCEAGNTGSIRLGRNGFSDTLNDSHCLRQKEKGLIFYFNTRDKLAWYVCTIYAHLWSYLYHYELFGSSVLS